MLKSTKKGLGFWQFFQPKNFLEKRVGFRGFKSIFRHVCPYVAPYISVFNTNTQPVLSNTPYQASSYPRFVIRIISILATIAVTIEFLSVMVICFALDIYYNDESKLADGSPLTVLQAPTPSWHWLFHIKAFITMIVAQVITCFLVMILLISLKCDKLKRQHGMMQKSIQNFSFRIL